MPIASSSVPLVPRPADSSAEPSAPAPACRPHNYSRRAFLHRAGTAVLGAGLSAGLAACAQPFPGIVTGRAAGQKVQLVYQDSSADWLVPMVAQQLELFMEQHPNIRVFCIPEPRVQADIESKTLAVMQAGTAPDVIMGCCTWFPIWAQKGYILDLRRYVAADIDKATLAEWSPAQYQAFFARNGLQHDVDELDPLPGAHQRLGRPHHGRQDGDDVHAV